MSAAAAAFTTDDDVSWRNGGGFAFVIGSVMNVIHRSIMSDCCCYFYWIRQHNIYMRRLWIIFLLLSDDVAGPADKRCVVGKRELDGVVRLFFSQKKNNKYATHYDVNLISI